MKCKLCGKKGVTLAHWRTAHKAYLARKSREAKRCACGKRANHRGEHKKGYRIGGTSEDRREVKRVRPKIREMAPMMVYQRCPECGATVRSVCDRGHVV